MGYHLLRPAELPFEERETESGVPRRTADLTTALALAESRARLFRFPPGTRGTRHLEKVQEEVFAVLEGTLTLALGDPAVREELPAGSIAAVEPHTALQMRNDGDADVVVLVWGAPPVTGQAEYLDDLGPA